MKKKRRVTPEEKAIRCSWDLLKRHGKQEIDLITVSYLMQLAYIQGFFRR